MRFIKLHWQIILLSSIVLFFFFSNFSSISIPTELGDEKYYIDAALDQKIGEFWSNIYHPPLGKLFILWGINIFGINFFGARIFSLIAGSLSIVLVFIIGKTLFSKKIGILAAILLALDPLWGAFSKMAMLDIYLSFFVLLSTFYLWNYFKNPTMKNAVIFGSALGLAAACKWTALFLVGPAAIFLFLSPTKKVSPKAIFFVFSSFVFFYFLPFVLWAASFDFGQFLKVQYQMSRIHISGIWPIEPLAIPPFLWFFQKPLFWQNQLPHAALISVGNPLLFWTWPILFFWLIKESLIKLAKKKFELFFLVLIFSFLFFPWLIPFRPTFSYYILPTVPFICIGTAYFLEKIWEKVGFVIFFGLSFAIYFAYLLEKI